MANFWLQSCQSCATTAASTINTIWVTWTATCDTTAITNLTIGNTTIGTGASADLIWGTWTTTGVVTIGNTVQYQDTRTAEQRAEEDARHQRMLDESLAKQKAASERARALLLSMLEVHQREQLQRDQYFEVIARHSKRRYRIRQGTHGNVRLLNEQGREVTRYCGQPDGVPTEDAMLAQKLQIEHDENAFLKAANATRVA